MPTWTLVDKDPPRHKPRELWACSDDGERFKIANIYQCSDGNAQILEAAALLLQTCKTVKKFLEQRDQKDQLIETLEYAIKQATERKEDANAPTA